MCTMYNAIQKGMSSNMIGFDYLITMIGPCGDISTLTHFLNIKIQWHCNVLLNTHFFRIPDFCSVLLLLSSSSSQVCIIILLCYKHFSFDLDLSLKSRQINVGMWKKMDVEALVAIFGVFQAMMDKTNPPILSPPNGLKATWPKSFSKVY